MKQKKILPLLSTVDFPSSHRQVFNSTSKRKLYPKNYVVQDVRPKKFYPTENKSGMKLYWQLKCYHIDWPNMYWRVTLKQPLSFPQFFWDYSHKKTETGNYYFFPPRLITMFVLRVIKGLLFIVERKKKKVLLACMQEISSLKA